MGCHNDADGRAFSKARERSKDAWRKQVIKIVQMHDIGRERFQLPGQCVAGCAIVNVSPSGYSRIVQIIGRKKRGLNTFPLQQIQNRGNMNFGPAASWIIVDVQDAHYTPAGACCETYFTTVLAT